MGRLKQGAIREDDRRQRVMMLGELDRRGLDVFCWCNRCGHNALIETSRLAGELGSGFPVPEIGARMRCSGCGSKDIAARPNWPSLGEPRAA